MRNNTDIQLTLLMGFSLQERQTETHQTPHRMKLNPENLKLQWIKATSLCFNNLPEGKRILSRKLKSRTSVIFHTLNEKYPIDRNK